MTRGEPRPRPQPQPPRAGPGRALFTLCVTEVTSYGSLYYGFPVMASEIAADTGWSTVSMTAGYSGAQLVAAGAGVPLGRYLDRHGPRTVMTAGSALAVLATVAIALAPSAEMFIGAWLVAGVAMGAILYPPAFTALTRWYGPRRVHALTWLTLAAGLASTIFAPITAVLTDQWGWRATYLIFAVVLGVITVPAHWWGLNIPWPRHPAEHTAVDRGHPDQVARSLPFFAVTGALSLASFAAFAALIGLVPLLLEAGFDIGTAALALGLGGAGQVAGRIGYPLLTRHIGVRTRTVTILGASAATIAILGVVTSTVLLLIAAIGAGVFRGLLTLVHATAVSDRWGTAHYGRLTGLMSAPITISIAVAPAAGAIIAEQTGGYTSAFVVIAVIGTLGAAAALVPTPHASADHMSHRET